MKKIVIAAVVLAAFVALIALMLLQTETPGGARPGKDGETAATAPDEAAAPEKARESGAKKGRPRAEETAPALAVSGVVKSADGRPLAGASVEAYAVPSAQDISDGERAGRDLLTKRFGGETADRILANDGLRTVLDRGDLSRVGDAIGAGMEVGLEMLTDDGGSELLSSVMRIGSEMMLAEDGDWVRAGSATTDGSGAFRIEAVPAGRIELRAKAPSFVKAKQRVNAGESGVTISLQPGVQLTGTVTSEGKPLDGADVVIRGARTQTAGGGRFAFDAAHVPAETLVVSAPACVAAGMIVQIAPGAPKDVAIDLEPACTVTGHVSALGAGPRALPPPR